MSRAAVSDGRMSLLLLQQIMQNLVSTTPEIQNVWITAELSDVAERGGHCYLELIEKNDSGVAVAKARAIIWASNWARIKYDFPRRTGRNFASGLKVMVKVVPNYHPLYGMSLVVTAVDYAYSLGDLEMRRQEMIECLRKSGVLELNRRLQFPSPALRVAVVSAPGAAGFGDFVNQLYHTNGLRLRFTARLFQAVMQGDRASTSVYDALERIERQKEEWDCVVIIRGGGSTSDLSCFEDYELAEKVATFPLPVIVGIGHERDVTLLDYVAHTRVKTPTAAAELLTDMAVGELENLRNLAGGILQTASDKVAGADRFLAYVEGVIPVAPEAAVNRARQRLTGALVALSGISGRRLQPMYGRLDRVAQGLESAWAMMLQRRLGRLDSMAELLGALSPEATLRRGYSITRSAGKIVTDASHLTPGTELETTLHNGTIKSITE
ncbi:MAG: exodeoxyribonuclease VII large subunit [Muribaculaceae bacterium]|nr:exodeoxyribonuclease VII large subunit [Muribaculaceae bacterium]